MANVSNVSLARSFSSSSSSRRSSSRASAALRMALSSRSLGLRAFVFDVAATSATPARHTASASTHRRPAPAAMPATSAEATLSLFTNGLELRLPGRALPASAAAASSVSISSTWAATASITAAVPPFACATARLSAIGGSAAGRNFSFARSLPRRTTRFATAARSRSSTSTPTDAIAASSSARTAFRSAVRCSAAIPRAISRPSAGTKPAAANSSSSFAITFVTARRTRASSADSCSARSVSSSASTSARRPAKSSSIATSSSASSPLRRSRSSWRLASSTQVTRFDAK
ncbi:MAG TPA: hypothetical protein DEP66_03780 [Acidimicrobiaceae bacterium]|nr:hypothetical protein [Acidimicrobiaceae bacterium]